MKHCHDDCKPCPELFGVMLMSRGRACCSDLEGWFKASDGSFELDDAERYCARTKEALVQDAADAAEQEREQEQRVVDSEQAIDAKCGSGMEDPVGRIDDMR